MTYGIRTKQIALARVADQAAANLTASTFAEATGIDDNAGLTDAEERRLSLAIEELTGTLHAIIKRNDPDGERHGSGSAG